MATNQINIVDQSNQNNHIKKLFTKKILRYINKLWNGLTVNK